MPMWNVRLGTSMDIERAIQEYVRRSHELFAILSGDPKAVSETDLRILETELHIFQLGLLTLKQKKSLSQPKKAVQPTAPSAQR